jgi:hypothetical protein
MMVERYGAYLEYRCFQQYSRFSLYGQQFFAMKPRSAAEFCTPHSAVGAELVRGDYEIGLVILHEIPGIGAKLVLELCDEALRAVQANARIASKTHSQQMVEAREVIHVSVGNENIAYPQQLSGRQTRNIADIKQKRASLEHQVNEHTGIPEDPVDQRRFKNGPHPGQDTISARRAQ